MSANDKGLIQELVKLRLDWKNRREEVLIGEVLDRPAGVALDLLLALIANGVTSPVIGSDLVSFVAESDLPIVARAVFAARDDGKSEDEDLLQQVALQNPDLVRDVSETMLDFKHWQEGGLDWWPTLHLIFEGGSNAKEFGGRYAARDRHPTWSLPAFPYKYRFGGRGTGRCRSCEQDRVHLLTIDSELPGFPQTKDRIVLETCPTCPVQAYYRHDAHGMPSQIDPVESSAYKWDFIPMKEQRVRLAATPPRWKHQSWAISNSRQNLSKVGGLPSWVQFDGTPVVPGTARKMGLLLQLDSGFETNDGGSMLWGSGGLLYVFWDSETRTSCHFSQCT